MAKWRFLVTGLVGADEPFGERPLEPAEIRAVQAELRSSSPMRGGPLPDDELIALALDFANDGNFMAYAQVLALARLPDRADPTKSNSKAAREIAGLMERERQGLREALAAIAAGRIAAGMRKSWQRRADGLVLVPAHGDDGTCRYRWLGFEDFKPPAPQFARALWLLASAATTRLCECQYRECRHFFRQPSKKGQKGGAQIRRYCPGTDHGDLEHNVGARERMSRGRAVRMLMAKYRFSEQVAQQCVEAVEARGLSPKELARLAKESHDKRPPRRS